MAKSGAWFKRVVAPHAASSRHPAPEEKETPPGGGAGRGLLCHYPGFARGSGHGVLRFAVLIAAPKA